MMQADRIVLAENGRKTFLLSANHKGTRLIPSLSLSPPSLCNSSPLPLLWAELAVASETTQVIESQYIS